MRSAPKQKEKAQRDDGYLCADCDSALVFPRSRVELDDLSLKYLKPEVYYDLVDKDRLCERGERQEFVNSLLSDEVKARIWKKLRIKAQVDGRVKAFLQHL